MNNASIETDGAAPAVSSTVELITGWGQYDTHSEILTTGKRNTRPVACKPYSTITGKDIVAMVQNPPSVPKADAQWIIPSTYRESDGREHKVQAEKGEFWYLPLDEDGTTNNNLSLDDVEAAVLEACGPVTRLIYSTRSSTAERRKWRALIPLMRPITGADYADTVAAFNARLIEASVGALIPDPVFERPGQLIFLPNRGEFYDFAAIGGDRLELTPDHPIIQHRDKIRAQRAAIEAAAQKRREERKIQADLDPYSNASVIEAFNALNSVAAMLERNGYLMSRNGRDYRSPNSSTGSYAVRDFGHCWFSFSGSDDAANIGQRHAGGRIGDAFDLFVHYEHGGKFTDAIKAHAKATGMDHKSRTARDAAEQLAEMLRRQKQGAGDGQGQSAGGGQGQGQDTPPPKPFFKRGSDLDGKKVPAREWLVQDLIPMSTVTLLSGDGGTGKSLLALQLAIAASTGRRWMGLEAKPGVTVTLSAEDDDDELHRRQFDIVRAQGSTLADLGQFVYRSMAGEDALLATLDPSGKLHPTPLYHQIDHTMTEEKPVLLVLDTSADLFPGNENDRSQVRQFIGLLKRLAIKHRCAVVLLSHPSLTGINSGSGLSGSTAWNNSVRSRLYFERVLLKDGLTTIEDNPDRRVLTGKKANHARNGAEMHMTWQNGVFVPDQAVTGLDAMAANNKADRVFLKLLDEFAKEGRFVKSANAAGYAPKVFATSGRAEGLSKQALHSAMERLFAKGEIVEVLGGDGPASKHTKRIMRAC